MSGVAPKSATSILQGTDYSAQVEQEHNEGWGIHRSEFVGNILLFVQHAGRMLRAMGYSGPIVISTALGPMLGVRWFYDVARSVLEPRRGSELDDRVFFSITTTSEALIGKPDGIAMDVLRYVLYSVNAPELVEKPETFTALIQKGYLHNCWPQPRSLRI